MSLRLGLVRPDRPLEVVAVAEARVIQHELARRLGDLTVDLRVDGPSTGPWLPLEHAAWPDDIDAQIDADRLWADDLPPLTTLFARTIDPAAADIRARMLAHIGVLPTERFDDDELANWIEIGAIRPTDLWLVATRADTLEITDRRVASFADVDEAGELDQVFDEIATSVETPAASADRSKRLLAALTAAHERADAAADEAIRIEREAVERCDRLRDEVRGVREQLERAELGRRLDDSVIASP